MPGISGGGLIMRQGCAGVLMAALCWPGAEAFAQEAKSAPAAPIEADLKIPDKMAAGPGGLDLTADIKPNLKPVHRRPKGVSKDELCGMVNVQRIDMGRGMATASPRECRRNGGTINGNIGFGGH